MEEHIIWDSSPDFDDWEEDLREEYPDASDDELVNIMYETNNDYLDGERANLRDIEVPNGIFAVAELGLWNGHFSGVLPHEKEPESVSDCLKSYVSGDSELTIYVDEDGDLRIREAHHDGTNSYLFRAYRPEVSDEQKEALWDLAHTGQEYESLMEQLTYRLGDLIGDVYGWTFPNRPECSEKGA